MAEYISLGDRFIGGPDDDEDDEENWQAISIPAKYAVCPNCRGKGSHVNPAIDGNGLTASDIDRLGGDEFMEDYLGGVYDVRCSECEGLRVVLVPDESLATPEQMKLYEEWEEERYQERQAELVEARYFGYFENRGY